MLIPHFVQNINLFICYVENFPYSAKKKIKLCENIYTNTAYSCILISFIFYYCIPLLKKKKKKSIVGKVHKRFDEIFYIIYLHVLLCTIIYYLYTYTNE